MRLKLFHGARMADAMTAVRTELGSDALILSSRKISGGFEVTAACLRVPDGPISPDTSLGNPVERERSLKIHGVPVKMRRQLLRGSLPGALTEMLRFRSNAFTASAKPSLFVGPGGAGKTLSIVRLSARYVLAGIKPHVISTDGSKAGANAQLSALLKVLGLELVIARPAELGVCLGRVRGNGPTLIDTAGSNPFVTAEGQCVRKLVMEHQLQAAFVMSALTAPEEAKAMAACYRAHGVSLLVVTGMDIASRYGSVLAAAHAGLDLTEAGIGSHVHEGIIPMTPDFLAQRLLTTPVGHELDDEI